MAHSVSRKAARLKPGLLYVGVDLALDSNQAKVVDERAKLLRCAAVAPLKRSQSRSA